MEEQTKSLDIKKFSVFKLAWPIFLQMFLSISLGYADTIMMSHYSEIAVGALGNANQILGFLALAFTVISSATGVIVAQYLGAKQNQDMNKIYTVAIFFNLFLSLILCAIVGLFSENLLIAIQVPPEMRSDANKYMKIVGFFLFTDAAVSVFSQIFNCNGKTSIGMFIFFGMNLMNIIGNYFFLYGPLSFLNLGTVGVATSTSISSTLGFVAAIICFKKIIHGKISFKFFKPFPKDILFKLIKLGVPSAGEHISYDISQIVITMFVNSLGFVAINTKIYCNLLVCFSMCYSNSVASATAIITGHCVGAEEYDYAYKRVLKTLFGALIICIGIAATNWLLSPWTLTFFTKSQEIISLGSKVMFVAFCLEFGRTANIVVIQSLRASGDVLFPTILGICSMWGISVVFAWLLGIHFGLGLIGVWIAMASDEIFRGIVVIIRWIKGSWRGKRVITPSENKEEKIEC